MNNNQCQDSLSSNLCLRLVFQTVSLAEYLVPLPLRFSFTISGVLANDVTIINYFADSLINIRRIRMRDCEFVVYPLHVCTSYSNSANSIVDCHLSRAQPVGQLLNDSTSLSVA